MTYWAYVENDQDIKEHSRLPVSWNNISNFHALENDKEFLNQLGWYELIDDTVPISNSILQYHDSPQYTVDHEAGLIRKNCPIIEREPAFEPEPEPTAEPNRDKFFFNLRQERRARLLASDWTQTVDLQAIRNDEWKTTWATYRRQLRDLPELYMQEEYMNVTDVDQVFWPIEPEIY